MSELASIGRIKLETELVNLGYRLEKGKAGEKEYVLGIVEFELRRPVSAGPETKEFTKLLKAFIKEFLPEHEITVLSGRGPIWLYAIATHELAHIVKALAVFDPKVEGAVIVATHTYDVPLEPGDVIKISAKTVKEMVQ